MSLLAQRPRFQQLLEHITIYRIDITMSRFGAATRKPTWLCSGPLRLNTCAGAGGERLGAEGVRVFRGSGGPTPLRMP
eukprot:14483931-Alexandrium_andersonii.AAC.1